MAWRYYFQIKAKLHIWRAFKHNILCDFLRNRNINAGIPQNSILRPLHFWIYINNLAEELSSNTKLFAGDTSLFSVVHNIDSSAAELNNDLAKISHWEQQWKGSFNRDPSKQAQEVIFSRKGNKGSHSLENRICSI